MRVEVGGIDTHSLRVHQQPNFHEVHQLLGKRNERGAMLSLSSIRIWLEVGVLVGFVLYLIAPALENVAIAGAHFFGS
jgi:hypothetical protein